ncbi:MAG: phosphate starvation-inducible protein PhoH [Bacteroidota bacterium]
MDDFIFTLENISPVEFFGIEDEYLRIIENSYPSSRIIPRGNEIIVKGSSKDVSKIEDIFNALLTHFHKYNHLNLEMVEAIVKTGTQTPSSGDDDVIVFGNKGNVIKARTTNQRNLVKAVNENDIVFALGPAGTGKTFISVALAVRALKNKTVKKIIFTRPAVEAGENLGFLPGDLKEKIDPYLRPIYDALGEMIPSEKLKMYQETNIIEIAPLAYMRGRTLNNAFVILDEAQNTTPMQLKMFLTRMGPTSKMIVNGDTSQIDLAPKQKSGLIEAIPILQNIKGIGFVTLDARDVLRHKLVKDIIIAYEKNNKS